MDEKTFKRWAEKLEQIGKLLEKLPSEVRLAAFELLQGYITETGSKDVEEKKGKEANRIKLKDEWKSKEDFFGAFTHDKPADNVKLIAAYLYHEYGSEPFSTEEVKIISDGVGITISERIDKTLSVSKDKGKKLFTKIGKGKFKPTVHGEAYLKAQYKVKKGTIKRPEETK
jgi:hypothetical protein